MRALSPLLICYAIVYLAGCGEPDLRSKAEAGDADAQVKLGNDYFFGNDGLPKDYSEAVKWYRKAAEQGSAAAQYDLGDMYAYGKGVPRDEAEAAKWFLKADRGDAHYQYGRGFAYDEGFGVSKNLAEAAKWYRKAADQRHRQAQENLADIYYARLDFAEAVKWYRKAAEQGGENAQIKLGKAYREGVGVPVDLVEAYAWRNLAAVSYVWPDAERVELEKMMTREEIIRAQQRSTELHKEIEAKMTAKQGGK